jgi:hypothetical protein
MEIKDTQWLPELFQVMEEIARRFGATELPPRLIEKAEKAATTCSNRIEMLQAKEKLKSSAHMHFLAEWSKGRIGGPVTDERIERLAAKAEEQGKRLAAQGKEKSAQQAIIKAQRIRSATVEDPESLQVMAPKRRSIEKTLDDPLTMEVFSYIKEKGKVTKKEVLEHFVGLDSGTWNSIIRALVQKLKVIQHGTKRGAYYQPRGTK